MEEQTVQAPETQEVREAEVSTQTSKQTIHESNLISMRRKLEAEEEARKQAELRAEQLEQRINGYQPQQPPQNVVEEEEFGVDNEDYVQAKYIKTSNKKFSAKLSDTQRELAEIKQKLAYFEARSETSSLKDFDEVVSDDNIRTLQRLYPDDYQSAMANPNLKSRAKTAYNMIKNYGIASTGIDSHAIDNKIAANKLRPKLASVGSPQQPQTPLSRLGDHERRILSESDRDRIMAEVQRKKSIG